MNIENKVCIYHRNCLDGFAAAWAARKRLGDGVTYLPAQYGEDPPDVEGKIVTIVDFSYPRDVLIDMAEKAIHVTVIDHHKTAEKNLSDLDIQNLKIIFDMNKSGCVLTWEYFFSESGYENSFSDFMPNLLKYVQDRDLWKFQYKETKAICAAMYSYEMDFQVWDELMEGGRLDRLVVDGEAILRNQERQIETYANYARPMRIGDFTVPAVCAPFFLISELGHRLCKDEAFAAIYSVTGYGNVVFSLRSNDKGLDVSEIAERFGGGGHRNAAGFSASLNSFVSDKNGVLLLEEYKQG